MGEQDYVSRGDLSPVVNAMSEIQETTLRVDERVKMLLERQEKSDIRISEINNNINSLVNRVTVLEHKDTTEMKLQVEKQREQIHDIEKQINTLVLKETGHAGKWKTAFDLGSKIFLGIISAWILYRLGLSSPTP